MRRQPARGVRPRQRVPLAGRRTTVAGRRPVARLLVRLRLGRRASAQRLLSGTRARGTGTAAVDRVHVRAAAPRRHQELPRRHTVHAVPARPSAVRGVPGHHPGGQLHVAQHVPRAPLEMPGQSRRLSAGRRPVPRVRPALRRHAARTSMRIYR